MNEMKNVAKFFTTFPTLADISYFFFRKVIDLPEFFKFLFNNYLYEFFAREPLQTVREIKTEKTTKVEIFPPEYDRKESANVIKGIVIIFTVTSFLIIFVSNLTLENIKKFYFFLMKFVASPILLFDKIFGSDMFAKLFGMQTKQDKENLRLARELLKYDKNIPKFQLEGGYEQTFAGYFKFFASQFIKGDWTIFSLLMVFIISFQSLFFASVLVIDPRKTFDLQSKKLKEGKLGESFFDFDFISNASKVDFLNISGYGKFITFKSNLGDEQKILLEDQMKNFKTLVNKKISYDVAVLFDVNYFLVQSANLFIQMNSGLVFDVGEANIFREQVEEGKQPQVKRPLFEFATNLYRFSYVFFKDPSYIPSDMVKSFVRNCLLFFSLYSTVKRQLNNGFLRPGFVMRGFTMQECITNLLNIFSCIAPQKEYNFLVDELNKFESSLQETRQESELIIQSILNYISTLFRKYFDVMDLDKFLEIQLAFKEKNLKIIDDLMKKQARILFKKVFEYKTTFSNIDFLNTIKFFLFKEFISTLYLLELKLLKVEEVDMTEEDE